MFIISPSRFTNFSQVNQVSQVNPLIKSLKQLKLNLKIVPHHYNTNYSSSKHILLTQNNL